MVLKGAALASLAYTVGGAEVLLAPREALAQGIALKVLTADERAALEALGETLLPGVKDAGLAHYVDQQLSVDPSECLLLGRALGIMPPYADFLPRRPCRARPVLSQGTRREILRARAGEARRVRRADPPEGSRGLERAAVAFLLFRLARRRGRRLLRHGRGFDVANLFITGGGLFPTIAGVHPTFTLHALTLRTADYMAKNWGGITS